MFKTFIYLIFKIDLLFIICDLIFSYYIIPLKTKN